MGKESGCDADLKNLFKVLDYKDKYDIVNYIHTEKFKKNSYLFTYNSHHLERYFLMIKGVSYFDTFRDEASKHQKKSGCMSDEDVDRYIALLDYTPEVAYMEYRDFVEQVRLEKETYRKCIDAELAKGDASEYAKEWLNFYIFRKPGSSDMAPDITKLDFLKLMNEFILNDDCEILPEDLAVVLAFLKCGCRF